MNNNFNNLQNLNYYKSYALGESGNPFFAIDPGLTIWTWLVFFTLLLVLYKFAWKPILSNLDAREKKIKKSINDAEKISQELHDTLNKKKSILSEANNEAKKIIERSKETAEKLKLEIENTAKQEAKNIIDNAHKKIELETEKALSELMNNSVELALNIASKVIKDNLNDDKNTALAKKYLEEVK